MSALQIPERYQSNTIQNYGHWLKPLKNMESDLIGSVIKCTKFPTKINKTLQIDQIDDEFNENE